MNKYFVAFIDHLFLFSLFGDMRVKKVLVTLGRLTLKIISCVSNWYCYIKMHVLYPKGYFELGMEFQKQMVPVCGCILHDNNDAL